MLIVSILKRYRALNDSRGISFGLLRYKQIKCMPYETIYRMPYIQLFISGFKPKTDRFPMKNSLPPIPNMNNTFTTSPSNRFPYRKAAPSASQQGRTDFPKEVIHPNRTFPHGSSRILSGQMPPAGGGGNRAGQFWCTVPRNHHDTFLVSFIAPLERFAGQPDGTDLLAGLQRADYGRKRQTPLFRRYRFRF